MVEGRRVTDAATLDIVTMVYAGLINKQVVAKLQAKGIQCIVATGRQLGVMETLPVGDIPFDGYLTLNGQMIHDREKNLIMGVPLSGKVKEFLVDRFNDHTYPAMFVEEREVYVNYISDHVIDVQEAISTAMPEVAEYTGRDIYQVCAYLRPEEECLLDPIAEDSVLTRWTYGGMDVIAKGGGKMKGIQRYLEMKGIKAEETIAFGDAENDLEMIRFAGIGVAMGNGEEQVKQQADYVTADVDDDGIAKALRHFGLIE
jgi:Cof subfamily protein (haloacid dehalogenase superfamily)